jgi:hypothetical protein
LCDAVPIAAKPITISNAAALVLFAHCSGSSRCTEKKLEIVAGATHLFEAPGALEKSLSS